MGAIPENAKPGDFFLVSFDGKNPNLEDPKKWALNGGLIRLGQWANGDGFGQYEHAAMYLGNNKVVEASGQGTVISDYHYQDDDTYWSTGIIEPTDAQRAKMVEAGTGYVGTPYSWPDYAAMAAVRFKLPLSSRFLKDYVSTSKHMICSQLVDQIYQDADYHLFDDHRWPGYVTPADLYNLLESKRTPG